MPNELCGTCQKPKCPSECVPNLGGKYCSNGMSMVNRCHGNCHPDDSGKVCQRCGQEGKHFCPVLAEEIKQATKEEHDKGYHSSPEPSCSSCDDSGRVCEDCEERDAGGLPCLIHPTPSTKSEGKCEKGCSEHRYHCGNCFSSLTYSPANYASRPQDIPNPCEKCHPNPQIGIASTPSDKDGEDWEVEFDKLLDKAPTPLGIKSFVRSHLQHQRILGRREQWKLDRLSIEKISTVQTPSDGKINTSLGECNPVYILKENALSALDSLNPDKSSPDAGREGII